MLGLATQEGNFVFYFCPACGSTVYFVAEGNDEVIFVPVGAFADPVFPSPTISIYERRRHPWLQLPIEFGHRQ